MKTHVYKILINIVAIIMLIVGSILFPLPIPLGAPMLGVALVMLIGNNDAFANLVKMIRRKSNWVNKFFILIEENIPETLSSVLARSNPNANPESTIKDDLPLTTKQHTT